MIESRIKVIVFDVYGTLFNVYSVEQQCEKLFPGKGRELCELWRRKQLEYSFLRQLMGTYEPFYTITRNALTYSCRQLELPYNDQKIENLLDGYLHLKLYKEVEYVLKSLEDKQLAVFSNGSLDMLKPLIKESPLKDINLKVISVDEAKVYKPTPMSYQIVLKQLSVNREEVLFVSSNTWDIAGAKNFGFNTAWINRQKIIFDSLGVTSDAEYTDLLGLINQNS